MMPVCVKCGLFFHPKRNSTVVEEGMPVGGEWKPYKLWYTDLVQCRGCGTEICIGFGREPFAEHYQPSYNARKEEQPPYVFVKDCC